MGASHYLYGFNDAELRRSGTLRPSQRVKRAELELVFGRPSPQATRRAVEELVDYMVGRVLDHLHLEHDLMQRWGADRLHQD